METIKTLQEFENRSTQKELTQRRFACAHCGNTWIELVGLFVGHKKESEDLCLRIGIESENCQTCKFRPRKCPECGSQDVYEIRFSENSYKETLLSLKRVNKGDRFHEA